MPSDRSDLRSRTLGAIRAAPIKGAQQLPSAKPMRPVPAPRNDDVDRAYWYDPGVEAPRMRGGYRPVDDQLYRIPTGEERSGADPQVPVWATGNLPPWNAPPFWGIPFSRDFELCVPTYEQEYTIGQITTGDMEMWVLKSVSYNLTSGLGQYELFEWKIYRSGAPRVTWEDMTIDPTTFDPSRRFVFAGDTAPLLVEERIDRARDARFTIKARGIVDLAGNSNHMPGDPIVPSANFRLTVNGWIAPLRENVDGGPRPTDLGLLGNLPGAF